MPPKKAPSRGRGASKSGSRGKGKGKGKNAKGKKGKGKGKKVNKKYAGLIVDGEFIAMKPRDQLEVIAEKVQSLIDCEREERIKFQTERDYFSQLTDTYMPKLRNLKIAHELNVCKIVRIKQDIEDQDGIKRQEAKHFRYEAQLRLSSAQMKDHLRQKRAKKRVENFWKYTCLEDDAVFEILEQFPTKVQKMMEKTRVKLDNVAEYFESVLESQRRYAAALKKTSDHLVTELLLYDFMEEIEVVEEANDLIYERMNDFEWIGVVAKAYYLQQVHNSLDGIVTMCDHWDDMDLEERLYEKLIEKAMDKKELTKDLFTAQQWPYQKSVSRHEGFLRLKRGLNTTYKSLRITERKISKSIEVYRELVNHAVKVDDDKLDFRASAVDLTMELWGGFLNRLDTEGKDRRLRQALEIAGEARDRQRTFYHTIEDADNDFYMYLKAMEEETTNTELAKERSFQILKQHDDMFLAVQAQLSHYEIAKHPLKYPITPIMIGQMRGLGHHPTGLVAKIAYKKRPHTPPKPSKLPWCGEEKPIYDST